ncbi:hypothetical protein [Paraburkholderia graminis]|uniref:hypothetical protein n=1 Tax=Paraburkholderia graminis TaxID=60548 RepID=UPI0031DFF487
MTDELMSSEVSRLTRDGYSSITVLPPLNTNLKSFPAMQKWLQETQNRGGKVTWHNKTSTESTVSEIVGDLVVVIGKAGMEYVKDSRIYGGLYQYDVVVLTKGSPPDISNPVDSVVFSCRAAQY